MLLAIAIDVRSSKVFFQDPEGEDDEDSTTIKCGDGEFLVRISHNDTKEVLYDEFE